MNHACKLISLAAFPLSLVLSSCGGNRKIEPVLSDVENYIEARPDSALAVLEGLRDEGDLYDAGRRVKAKFALLYSMALDKNYIDLCSDSVLAPALQFYAHRGTADDRMRTCYYKARTCENAGDEDEAMEWLVKGERYAGDARDCNTKGRLYSRKGKYYAAQMKYPKACDNYLFSAESYKRAENYALYSRNVLKASNCLFLSNDKELADSLLDCVCQYLPILGDSDLSSYYEERIIQAHTVDERASAVNEYISSIQSSRIDWLRVADACLSSGDIDGLDNALSVYENNANSDIGNNARYQLYKSKSLSHHGNSEGAFEHLQEYVSLTDSIAFRAAYRDTEFVEEHTHDREIIDTQKYRNTILAMTVLVAFLVIALMALAVKQLRGRANEFERRNKEMSALYDSLLDERDSLKQLLAAPHDNSGYDIFRKRYNVINSFISSCVVSDSRVPDGVMDELKALISDRSEYVNDSVALVSSFYPDFTSYLKGHGLTDKEIKYCCLLALGMRGKDIGNFIGVSRHYHYGADIRKKLGLSREVHLHTFIQTFLSGNNGK